MDMNHSACYDSGISQIRSNTFSSINGNISFTNPIHPQSNKNRVVTVLQYQNIETLPWDNEQDDTQTKMSEDQKQEYSKQLRQWDEIIQDLLKCYYTCDNGDVEQIKSELDNSKEDAEKFYHRFQGWGDILKIRRACIYLALEDNYVEGVTCLKGVQSPEVIDADESNAGNQRVLFLIRAGLFIYKGNYKEAEQWLLKCWNVKQEFFEGKEEDSLDFYADYMGRMMLEQKKCSEAEKWFKDALELRIRLKHPRLLSLSYNYLALTCIQMGKSERDYRQKALEYLRQAKEYDREFMKQLEVNPQIVLMGQVDYRRADLETTEKEIRSLE